LHQLSISYYDQLHENKLFYHVFNKKQQMADKDLEYVELLSRNIYLLNIIIFKQHFLNNRLAI